MGEDAVDLIFRASFISPATADADGLPWCTPLEFACDEDANVYWVSRVDARHSINLRSNPRVALAIFNSGQIPGVGRAKGLYAEGPVHEVDPAEVDRIMPSMERWLAWRDEDRAEPRPRRPSGPGPGWTIYRLSPVSWYALDVGADPHAVPAEWRVPVDLQDSLRRRYQARQRVRPGG